VKQIKPKADILIEVSYEIVKKLGGIHTVIKTKAPFMKKYYGNNYLVIGLYTKKDARKKFKRKEPNKEIRNLFVELKKEKIICHYGTWNAKSKPKAILVDISKIKKDRKTKNEIYKDYWIDLSPKRLEKPKLYSSSLIWSFATGKLISELIKLNQFKKKKVVVNIHEYMSGLTLLYLRKHKCNVPIVFTTHSTVLGRAIVHAGDNLYRDLFIYKKKNKKSYSEKIISYQYRLGEKIYNRHLYEKACAKKADVLTTVSETTSKEAAFVLDKPADIVTPNGLDIITPPSIEEQFAINYKAKQKILRFLQHYFSPYYPINTEDSLLFYTAGRYEIYTKGYDLFFEALNRLNTQLKGEQYPRNIFVFLFIIIGKKKIKKEIIKSLKFSKNKKLKLKEKYPPNCLFKARENLLLSHLEKNKLLNRPKDKVKLLFYPAPVRKKDKLLSMHYKEAVSSMDLGIFPSLYEPWGYTPLETAAMSTIAITTDVAGFGNFIQKRTDQRKIPGIIVLKTKGRNKKQIVENLTKTMHQIVYMPKEKRLEKRIEANKLAKLANWEDFSKEYIRAHNLAIKKHRAKK
jgi:phosphorylase/glycogen(starch) synthase